MENRIEMETTNCMQIYKHVLYYILYYSNIIMTTVDNMHRTEELPKMVEKNTK